MTLRVERYRVVWVEPLVGGGRTGIQTEVEAVGERLAPTRETIRRLEGQAVTLTDLKRMGLLCWESDRVVQLTTPRGSYRIALEPEPLP